MTAIIDVVSNPARMPTWLKWTLGVSGVLAAGTGIALVARKASAAKPKVIPPPGPTPSPGPEPAPSPEVLDPGTHPVYTGDAYILDSGTNKSVKSILWHPITDGASVDDIEYAWDQNSSKLHVGIVGPYAGGTQILDVHTFADADQTEPIASWRLMLLNPRAA